MYVPGAGISTAWPWVSVSVEMTLNFLLAAHLRWNLILSVCIFVHTIFFSLVFFFSMSSLQLLLVATEMSGSQCIAGWCILFTRLLILSLLAYIFSFGLWFSLCMCMLMFKSVNKGLLLPYVKNVWHCEEFLPVGAQIHYFILEEAVKLHCFPFFVEEEGKVALGSQMRWIYFLSSFRSFFACLECLILFAVSHLFKYFSTLPELI